jgi:hypothetical protein
LSTVWLSTVWSSTVWLSAPERGFWCWVRFELWWEKLVVEQLMVESGTERA